VGFGPLIHHAIELSGVAGRAPRLCHIATALGDERSWHATFEGAGRAAGIDVAALNLFPMPNVSDVPGFLAEAPPTLSAPTCGR
jgi:hypothetical protein